MFPAFQKLSGKRVVLASSSPRRLDIFNRVVAGLHPECIPSGFPEDLDWRQFGPKQYVLINSKKKVEWLSDRLMADKNPPSIIIGSDTVVCFHGQVLEKATSREHAFEMLRSLSGETVEIHTGVYAPYRSKDGEDKFLQFFDTVEVKMRTYDDNMINGYLDLGNGMDNAGALAIQEGGIVLVEGIVGDFYSAVGFPMSKFYQELSKIANEII